VLLKSFQLEGRFPDTLKEVATSVVTHLARQMGVPPDSVLNDGEWSERTQRSQRAQVREHCGFRTFHAADEPAFVHWLSERVTTLNPDAEEFPTTACAHLREHHLEPPGTERLRRLLRLAVAHHEERLVSDTAAQLSSAMCRALDTLVSTEPTELGSDDDQMTLFLVRSDLASVKHDAGAVSVDTVLAEIVKLQRLRALGLPEQLFRGVPTKLVTQYRQRAASEPPRELRRHPPNVRHTLLAALCWQREQEITDNLVEMLMRIAHRVGVRAEEKVEAELLTYAQKVLGKARLLYQLAKAATGQPDGLVRDVIYPDVGEQTLNALIQEVEAAEQHDRHVKLVTRASYSHHYRRIMPALLEVLSFQCNNDRYRPVMNALALLNKYRGRKAPTFPTGETVPLDGVVAKGWQDLVHNDEHGEINRISYEWCVLTTLREKLRCKEVWVKGARRFRNPDEDVPQNFEVRRNEYYAALKHPPNARVFVETVRRRMDQALAELNASLPTNGLVRLESITNPGVTQDEAPRSKLRGITELNSEDFSEGEANPVASYGECQVQRAAPSDRSTLIVNDSRADDAAPPQHRLPRHSPAPNTITI